MFVIVSIAKQLHGHGHVCIPCSYHVGPVKSIITHDIQTTCNPDF